MIHRWISDVEPSAPVTEILDGLFNEKKDGGQNTNGDPALSQLSKYDKFIRESEAYRWLQSKMQQHSRLCTEDPNLMHRISETIQARLRTYGALRKISHRRPLSFVQMTFSLDWNLLHFIHTGFKDPPADILNQIYCLTGSENAVQFTTVIEYMHQTWPETVEPILNLLNQLITLPEGQECSCEAQHSHFTIKLLILFSRPAARFRPRIWP